MYKTEMAQRVVQALYLLETKPKMTIKKKKGVYEKKVMALVRSQSKNELCPRFKLAIKILKDHNIPL